ncbi:Zinc ABC transporter, substrate-binding protein [Candidatus Magnetomoraceae bacterium gMMP-15]
MNRILYIIVLICYVIFYGSNIYAEKSISVFVSILPQKYFVEKIGGKLVDVSVMVKPGASPATYEPKPAQMVALSKAKIYYAIGVPFENIWLKKIASFNSEMLVAHTENGIEKISMKGFYNEKIESRQHKKKNIIKDPHIWLSPRLVMLQARNILNTLIIVDPAHQLVYETGYKKFINELVDIDIEIKNIFVEKKEVEFMVFHPSWGYFARAYGLKQTPAEIEGKKPRSAQLRKLINYAREKSIKIIFVQPQFSTKHAEIIAKAIGGQIVFADPLALNWADNLRSVAERFQAALK